jgi:hypothetical protein
VTGTLAPAFPAAAPTVAAGPVARARVNPPPLRRGPPF